MRAPIILRVNRDVDYYKDAIGSVKEKESLEAYVTDDHIRAIHARMLSMGLTFPAATPEESSPAVKESLTAQPATPAPASPVDDEATVDALMAITRGTAIGGRYHVIHDRLDACEVVAAIRRGEVPGLTTTDKCSDLINEHARAMNERDTLRRKCADLEEYRSLNGKMCDEAQRRCDALQAEVERMRSSENAQLVQSRETVKVLQSQRNAADARAKKAEAEVERLRSELARITSHYQHAKSMWGKCEDERDAAIARAEKAEVELAKSEQAHMELAKGELFQIRTANQERDAAIARADSMIKPEVHAHAVRMAEEARAAHAEAVELLRQYRTLAEIYQPDRECDALLAEIDREGK